MNEPLASCQFVEMIPVYAKKLAGISICPSEFTHPDGAHIMDREIRCHSVADAGERFCPRHKAIAEAPRTAETTKESK